MRIIALGHYSRTGKDSLANFLVDKLAKQAPALRVLKRSLAWKLKQICFELYGWAGVREPEYYETPEGAAAREQVLPALGKTPVELWVDFGTKAVRDNVYDRTWLDYLFKTDHGCDVLIVPDIRFPNEGDEVIARNGVLIKVVRAGHGPRNTSADRALLGYSKWHYVVGGFNGLPELAAFASVLVPSILGTGGLPYQSDTIRRLQLSMELQS